MERTFAASTESESEREARPGYPPFIFSQHLSLHLPEPPLAPPEELNSVVASVLEFLRPKYEDGEAGALQVSGLAPAVRLSITWSTPTGSPAGTTSAWEGQQYSFAVFSDGYPIGEVLVFAGVPKVQLLELQLLNKCAQNGEDHANCRAPVSDNTVTIRQKFDSPAQKYRNIDLQSCMRVQMSVGFRLQDVRHLQDVVAGEARQHAERARKHLQKMVETATVLGNGSSAEQLRNLELAVAAKLVRLDFAEPLPVAVADFDRHSWQITPSNRHQEEDLLIFALAYQGARSGLFRLALQRRRLQAVQIVYDNWTHPDE